MSKPDGGRKKVVHLAEWVPTNSRMFGWRFSDSPWKAACGFTPDKIRLTSYKREVTCALCLRRLKEEAKP